MNTLTCVGCSAVFLVDSSKRCWWLQKFCDVECRTKFDEFSMTHSASVALAKDILRGNFLAIGSAGLPSLFIGG